MKPENKSIEASANINVGIIVMCEFLSNYFGEDYFLNSPIAANREILELAIMNGFVTEWKEKGCMTVYSINPKGRMYLRRNA